jgi:hypothetical protein
MQAPRRSRALATQPQALQRNVGWMQSPQAVERLIALCAADRIHDPKASRPASYLKRRCHGWRIAGDPCKGWQRNSSVPPLELNGTDLKIREVGNAQGTRRNRSNCGNRRTNCHIGWPGQRGWICRRTSSFARAAESQPGAKYAGAANRSSVQRVSKCHNRESELMGFGRHPMCLRRDAIVARTNAGSKKS